MNTNMKYLVLIYMFSTVHGEADVNEYEPSNYDISRNRQLGDQVLSFILTKENIQGTKYCAKVSCNSSKKQQLLSSVLVKGNHKFNPRCETYKCNIRSYKGQIKRLGLSQFLDYLLGNNYYPGYQPGVNYPGHYPANYPGSYGENPGLIGPPGAHPGCPLCDSSVYSYCSHKQAHDSCCCGGGSYFACRNVDCKFLYANSCQEFNLISRCCCVDLQKNVPVAPVV